ncbi:unnamed protein product [Phyllotreta striolata]|uniref:CUB domain-containing protein n=1 Tax=Phyllotreta striolata TaxID=444603 RepID=A0A9N9XWE0_PHYSR|nr:unnamed protein product [Phyllotreta striolata]
MLGVVVWFSVIPTVVYCWSDNWFGDLFNPKTNQLAKANDNQRNSRFLSLFTYVQYQIPECMDGDGNYGTCTSPSECIARGGTISGACAGGYGACCLFFATCGTTVRENGTYFVNNEYPEGYDGTGSCQVTLLKSNPDICQFRLDFAELNIMQPDAQNHICNNDQFLASGGNPAPWTVVSEKMENSDTANTVQPEQGCLQYFTGVSGQILSYNYDPVAGAQLSNQDYSICVRPEWNFCGIQYTQCPNNDPGKYI